MLPSESVPCGMCEYCSYVNEAVCLGFSTKLISSNVKNSPDQSCRIHTHPHSLFEPAGTLVILTLDGAHNYKMAAVGGIANHKMSGSKFMCISNSNTSAFQIEGLFNSMSFKISMLFKIFYCIFTEEVYRLS